MLVAQQLHEFDAVINAIRLEVLEVEATARVCGIDLARKVDELDKRAANLVWQWSVKQGKH